MFVVEPKWLLHLDDEAPDGCNLFYSTVHMTHALQRWNWYRCGQTTWRVSDRHERLVTVAAEVLATPCLKHLPQISVLVSSSSRAVESIVWVTWTFCLCFKISFYWQRVLYFYFLRSDAFWMTSISAINVLELRRHPHAKLFAHIYTWVLFWSFAYVLLHY
jgi:hypothetical protein